MRGKSVRRLRFAEAVEEVIEEDAEDGVDDAGDEETHGEPGLRLREEQFLYQHDNALMQGEKCGGQRESRERMLGVEARADGRGEIADHGFGDSEKADRSFAQTVLQQTDKGAE